MGQHCPTLLSPGGINIGQCYSASLRVTPLLQLAAATRYYNSLQKLADTNHCYNSMPQLTAATLCNNSATIRYYNSLLQNNTTYFSDKYIRVLI